MIENNESIQSMCSNIIEQVQIIKNDFLYNGETHYAYILEKLNKAQWDLDALIEMAEDKKYEIEQSEVVEGIPF